MPSWRLQCTPNAAGTARSAPTATRSRCCPTPTCYPAYPKRGWPGLKEPSPNLFTENGHVPRKERRNTGDWSRNVKDALADAIAGMTKGSRHDTALRAAATLARYETLGHPGAADALESLGSSFTAQTRTVPTPMRLSENGTTSWSQPGRR